VNPLATLKILFASLPEITAFKLSPMNLTFLLIEIPVAGVESSK
jgi:hypothetical protein